MDRTEIGHSWFEGRLLVGHRPRGWCGVAVDASFVEQPGVPALADSRGSGRHLMVDEGSVCDGVRRLGGV